MIEPAVESKRNEAMKKTATFKEAQKQSSSKDSARADDDDLAVAQQEDAVLKKMN